MKRSNIYQEVWLEGDLSLTDQNRVYYSKTPLSLSLPPCVRDVYCGKLFCSGGQSDPNYGSTVAFSDCKAASFWDAAADYGQVDAGTKCGEGKVHPPQHLQPLPVQCSVEYWLLIGSTPFPGCASSTTGPF